MKESVIWGAIVGIALGVMVTFALARGLLALPWQLETPTQPPRPMHDARDADPRVHGRTSPGPAPLSNAIGSEAVEPRRPARPGNADVGPVASLGSPPFDLSRS